MGLLFMLLSKQRVLAMPTRAGLVGKACCCLHVTVCGLVLVSLSPACATSCVTYTVLGRSQFHWLLHACRTSSQAVNCCWSVHDLLIQCIIFASLWNTWMWQRRDVYRRMCKISQISMSTARQHLRTQAQVTDMQQHRRWSLSNALRWVIFLLQRVGTRRSCKNRLGHRRVAGTGFSTPDTDTEAACRCSDLS